MRDAASYLPAYGRIGFQKMAHCCRAAEMEAKTRIYVDTNHWVNMRKVEMGHPAPPAYREILWHLRRLVSSGRFICPLSPALFIELTSQSDLKTRLHTAQLMEELSHGVGLPHLNELEKLELRHQAFKAFPQLDSGDMNWPAWTKAAFLLGDVCPSPPPWIRNEKQVWRLQKQFIDMLWETPFTQIISEWPQYVETKTLRAIFAKVMNANREPLPSKNFEIERQRANARVLREVLQPEILKVAAELEQLAATQSSFQMPKLNSDSGSDPWCIPSVQIVAGVEALIRTTNRKFRDNDMFDLFHCATAIPYCQIFFCDNGFKNILNDPNLDYSRKYDVMI